MRAATCCLRLVKVRASIAKISARARMSAEASLAPGAVMFIC
jgi:hypothetical protein